MLLIFFLALAYIAYHFDVKTRRIMASDLTASLQYNGN